MFIWLVNTPSISVSLNQMNFPWSRSSSVKKKLSMWENHPNENIDARYI